MEEVRRVKAGDLVKMKWHPDREYGLILNFELQGRWARVHWPDDGICLEKIRDLEVTNEAR